jgi:lipid A 3-O-deacylase
MGKDPSDLHAYRASVLYRSINLHWERFSILFAAGYGHWWSSSAKAYKELNIISLAPIFRFHASQYKSLSPFFDISIGPSYLSGTRFSDRKLGIHYAFQDEVAVGAYFGKRQQFAVSFSSLHYSNGSMSAKNAGITVPLLLKLEYFFE